MAKDRGQCLSCHTGRLVLKDTGAVECTNAPACKAGWSAAVEAEPEPKNYVKGDDVEAFLKRLRSLPKG